MIKSAIAVLALGLAAAAANAATVSVNLAGFSALGGYGATGNSSVTLSLPAGSTIDAISFEGLEFTALGDSWQRELVLSLNDSPAGVGGFWDFNPGVGILSPGTFGPASGSFPTAGLFGSGPFTLTTGSLYIEVYDTFNDPGIDATISTGTLIITYTEIPTPAAASLLGLGGLVAARRRRS
jgi:hypothetical protein